MAEIFLSIGTNLGDKKKNLDSALTEIKLQIGKITSLSSIYESEPWGFDTEDHFFNIMIGVTTTMNPEQLLRACQNIEIELGRIKSEQTGYTSRLIDIDIVYFDNLIVAMPHLQIPHPLMQERNFVLAPLCEIAPTKLHPLFNLNSVEMQNNCADKILVTKRSDLALLPL